MRFISLLSAFLFILGFFSHPSFAFEPINIVASGLDVQSGYRVDQLDWNISGDTDGNNPNILSELRWDDIKIFQISASGWLEFNEVPYLDRILFTLVDISFGKVFSGDVRDSDYAADDRNAEWSRSVNDADKGLTIDLSGAVGSQVVLNSSRFSITPFIGYSFNLQDLSMTNGEQVVSDPRIREDYFGSDAEKPHELGHISGLDSTYTTYWYGPWLGVTGGYEVKNKFNVSVGVEYHWIEYFAQADWNLRSEFDHPVSFEHNARGSGLVWNFKGAYSFDESWSWLVSGDIQNWHTGSGTDRILYSDGSAGKTRLNRVNWDSYSLSSGLQYRF